ncbi:hypothetical protein WICPIJ_004963 [Wickerhamomyces pijperi]|uniref:Transcription initiation factor IIF subunit beta n=1 Tax=Wickerhamomyces pijperi TaxID=599730 RepID=A0A9P8TM96_WICPI|nr:hypothetical protein WICPIJ_004963 [Wickerhamomyces pijperi]
MSSSDPIRSRPSSKEEEEEEGPPLTLEERQQKVLQEQQENDGSDEEYLSDGAEIVDSNDISQRESLNLDLEASDQKVWLVRLPRFLAEKWNNKETLNGQHLGRIKIRPKMTNKDRGNIELELDATEDNQDIPHRYKIEVTRPEVQNQYVFTEENLAKYNEEQKERLNRSHQREAAFAQGLADPTLPPVVDDDLLDDEEDDPEAAEDAAKRQERIKALQSEFDESLANVKDNLRPLTKRERYFQQKRRRKFNKFKNKDGSNKVIPFVKTIPKKTSLVGTIVHECQVMPLMSDPNYSKIITDRKKYITDEPRPTVTLLKEASGAMSNAGLTLRTDTSTFLRPTATATKKSSEGRAIRIPQKDLLDLLFKLFDEYDYWSLKGLKERTKQPEVFLKETLDQIAQLIKRGPYIGKWALKKEFKELKNQERAEKLGADAVTVEESEEEEDHADVEMEDVV